MPQYKSLSLDKLAQFINSHTEVHFFYPEEKEMRKLPKQWITNVAYAVLDDTFSGWVKSQIEERNSKVALKGNMHIESDPEIHAAFLASSAVSRKCPQPSQFGSSISLWPTRTGHIRIKGKQSFASKELFQQKLRI